MSFDAFTHSFVKSQAQHLAKRPKAFRVQVRTLNLSPRGKGVDCWNFYNNSKLSNQFEVPPPYSEVAGPSGKEKLEGIIHFDLGLLTSDGCILYIVILIDLANICRNWKWRSGSKSRRQPRIRRNFQYMWDMTMWLILVIHGTMWKYRNGLILFHPIRFQMTTMTKKTTMAKMPMEEKPMTENPVRISMTPTEQNESSNDFHNNYWDSN